MKRPLLSSTLASLVALPLALGVAGCFSIGSQEITVVDPPPLAWSVSDDAISLTEGTSIVVRIAVLDHDQYLIDPTEIAWTVSSPNATIVDTLTPGVYVVSAVHEGSATLDGTRSGGGGDATIDVTVTAQPAP